MTSAFISISLFCVASVFAVCGPKPKYGPDTSSTDYEPQFVKIGEMTLPSGNRITVRSVKKVNLISGETALAVEYLTSLSLGRDREHMDKLRTEAEEIWQIFHHDVRLARLDAASLRARSGASGQDFVFLKKWNGDWYCTNDEQEQTSKG